MAERDQVLTRDEAILIATPVSVGHVKPLLPVAKRLVKRGFTVVWAISGDGNEPAAKWREPLAEHGVVFVDVDAVAMFSRGEGGDFATANLLSSLLRRICGRANDVAEAAAGAIRAAVGERRIRCGLYDFFALWGYVAMKRLGVQQVDVVVSAFPGMLDQLLPGAAFADDAIYQRELAQLRDAGFGAFAELPRAGMIPRDKALRVLCFTSSQLCPKPPDYVQLLGVSHDALPHADDLSAAPEADQALARRLEAARDGGARVVLLSLGTMVTRMFSRLSPAHVAFLKRLYTSLAASALRAGAVVVASTCDSSAADLGVDEAALGPEARDRVIAMPFVPQPLLFSQGLVDVMLMHGGANTFHETVASGIPVLVCPGFGDQDSVATAVANLGVGVRVESINYPAAASALPIDRVADEILPAMLAPGTSRWKAEAMRLAEHVAHEDGLDAIEALLLG
jgi:UDP:flavonoid glycosyltransferase YjiC (YdhE family)